ncbi:unnamed protein product [Prorocentrum cordatum]|uniref:Uncharacterized protein n=1 Tax=Prorocentrum cordatum TaxID=2364126 RepID=A0ABN9VJS3_9DINO|nr:unnamed protein product [Polarella glacialis]
MTDGAGDILAVAEFRSSTVFSSLASAFCAPVRSTSGPAPMMSASTSPLLKTKRGDLLLHVSEPHVVRLKLLIHITVHSMHIQGPNSKHISMRMNAGSPHPASQEADPTSHQ